MNKRDWYFKQIVSQSDLDEAFDWVEDADRDIMADLMSEPVSGSVDYGGIMDGGVVQEQAVPDLTVQIDAIIAWGKAGERLKDTTPVTNVDLSQDEYGTSTVVPTPGQERVISVFVRFKGTLQNPEVDGNGLTVYTRRIEAIEYFVRQGAPSAPTATPPPLLSDALLLADITRANGQTTIQTSNISLTRREDWIRDIGTTLGSFVKGTAKEAIKALFGFVDTASSGGGAFSFGEDWYGSVAPGVVSGAPATIAEALDAIVEDLAATTGGSDLIGSPLIAGSPALAAGSVLDQLTTLLANVNDKASKSVDEAITGAWNFDNQLSEPSNISELENARLGIAPYAPTLLGGSLPPGLSNANLARGLITGTIGGGAPWGSPRNYYNNISFGPGDDIRGPVLGQHSDGRRVIIVLDADVSLKFRKIDPRTNAIITTSSTLGSTLPSTGGNWEGETIISDNLHIYVMFQEYTGTPANDRHCIQAYNASDFLVKTGWPATGRLLPGASPSQGRHPDRATAYGNSLARMCFASDETIVTLNSWVSCVAAASPCVSTIAVADGTISGYGAGNCPTGANVYPLMGLAVNSLSNHIWFAARDDVSNTVYIASASVSTPSSAGAGGSLPYTWPDTGATIYPGPIFFDGNTIWTFGGSWNAGTNVSKLMSFNTSGSLRSVVLFDDVTDPTWNYYMVAGGRCVHDGLSLYIPARQGAGSEISALIKFPLTGFKSDAGGHYLREYPGVVSFVHGNEPDDDYHPYQCGGMCFDGDSIWVAPEMGTGGNGTGYIVRYPMMRMR